MTAVSKLNAGLPFNSNYATGVHGFSNHSLDANNDGVAFLFQAQTANAITHVGFRYGARTGTPPTYVATLETVAATGLPSGTDVGGGSATAKTFTPPADATWNGTWQWIALTNSYTPAIGDWLCFTIRYSSGTVDASNFSTFTYSASNTLSTATVFPAYLRLTAGTWAYAIGHPVFGVRTASERYGQIFTATYNTRTASTVGRRIAMKFTLPDICDTYQVRGIRFSGSIAPATAGKNPLCKLWSASAALQSVTLDSDSLLTSQTCAHEVFFPDSLATLSPGTAYYAGLEVADAASSSVVINGAQLDNSADLAAYPGGSNFHLATYDGANWTDDQTVRPFMELLFEDVTKPAGGSAGILVPGGMVGGMRG